MKPIKAQNNAELKHGMMTDKKQGNMLKKNINLILIYSYRTINYNESHIQYLYIITN
jgi:hypothetical protein